MNRSIKVTLFLAGILLILMGASSVVFAAPDDNIPGVPLPSPSPAVGNLAQGTDNYDIYSVNLQAGETFQVTLSGDAGTDFDLYLYGPGSTNVDTDPYLTRAASSIYPDGFSYTIPAGGNGTYYLSVEAFSGTGNYQIDYTIAPGNPDDNIPGVTLPTSPVSGNLNKGTDVHDVYRINLQEGSTFQTSLTGDAGTDFDLHLFGPGSTDVYTNNSLQDAITGGYPDGFSYTVPAGGAGAYYLDVEAFSGMGKYQVAYTDSNPVPADTTFPSVTNVMPAGTVNTSAPAISADYSDGTGSGINTGSVVVNLDGAQLTGCSATATGVSCPATGLADGNHTISGSVADNAGNSSPISGAFTVDTTAPATVVTSPQTWKRSNFTVFLNCSDPQPQGVTAVSGCENHYWLDNGKEQIGNSVAIITNGDHVIKYYSKDNAGNLTPTKSVRARLDKALPAITSIGPAGTNRSDTVISARYADSLSGIKATTAQVKLDGKAVNGCRATATGVSCPVSGLRKGTHTISVIVSDNAGNLTIKRRPFVYDATPPAITRISPTGTIGTGSVTLRATLTDPFVWGYAGGINTGVIVRLDGKVKSCRVTRTSATQASVSCLATGLSKGNHTVSILTRDFAGNAWSRTWAFRRQ